MNATRQPQGFTLIELLVVIGLIAVLAGGIGLALGRGDGGVAMQNAQGILSSGISSAKSLAALNQANAGLYVNVDPNSDNFLHEVRIGYAMSVDDDGNPVTPNVNVRVQRGDPIVLPKGIYVVPSNGALAAYVDYGNINDSANPVSATLWSTPDNLKSSLYTATDVPLKLNNGTTNVPGTYHLLVDFDSRGNPNLGAGSRITLAAAVRRAGDKLLFDKPDSVRALVLSRYGFTSYVNGRESFQ